ncbi:hypothetical protein GCM10011428_79920 [Streptomyces violaceus]
MAGDSRRDQGVQGVHGAVVDGGGQSLAVDQPGHGLADLGLVQGLARAGVEVQVAGLGAVRLEDALGRVARVQAGEDPGRQLAGRDLDPPVLPGGVEGAGAVVVAQLDGAVRAALDGALVAGVGREDRLGVLRVGGEGVRAGAVDTVVGAQLGGRVRGWSTMEPAPVATLNGKVASGEDRWKVTVSRSALTDLRVSSRAPGRRAT